MRKRYCSIQSSELDPFYQKNSIFNSKNNKNNNIFLIIIFPKLKKLLFLFFNCFQFLNFNFIITAKK